MNPHDLPEVVAELIIEIPEVRAEIRSLNTRVDRLEQVVATGFHELREELRSTHKEQRGMREDIQAMPDRIGAVVFKSLEHFLSCLLEHDGQLRNHESRLGKLESPQ